MTIKISDLTKGSKWKVIAPIQAYRSASPYDYKYNDEGKFVQVIDGKCLGSIIQPCTELVLRSKPSSWGSSNNSDEHLGQMLEFGVGDKITYLSFKNVRDSVELMEQPADVVYLIRDSVTGYFYKGTFSMYFSPMCEQGRKEREKKILSNHAATDPARVVSRWDTRVAGPNGWVQENHPIVEIEWSKTPGSGKVMKTLGLCKQRLLFTVGYYNQMGDNAPGMLYNRDDIREIPSTWEIVSYDKVSKSITSLENAKAYVDNALRLQGLTIKYGSAVRDLYSKLEKKGELDSFKGFMVFTPGPGGIIDAGTWENPNPLVEWQFTSAKHSHDGGYVYKIIKEEVDGVKSIVNKDMRKSFQGDSLAVALKSVKDALVLKLTYTGRLTCTVIDMDTLNEETA